MPQRPPRQPRRRPRALGQSPASGSVAPLPAGEATQRYRRSRLRALRAGITSFAMLGGLSCFVLLSQAHVSQLIATIAGLLFAVLVRVAVGSLAHDALLGATRSSPAAAPPAETTRSDN